jgi:hypothetical protein
MKLKQGNFTYRNIFIELFPDQHPSILAPPPPSSYASRMAWGRFYEFIASVIYKYKKITDKNENIKRSWIYIL